MRTLKTFTKSPWPRSFARLFLLAVALTLAGCATYTKTELAQFRQLSLPPELLWKLEHRGPFDAGDLIVLKRAGVRDEQVIRHLENVGVRSLVTRADVTRLRKAGVRAAVIDALLRASDDFAIRQTTRSYYAPGYYYYDDPWLWPGIHGAWSVGYTGRIG